MTEPQASTDTVPKDPTRPWKIATAVLALALVFCLGVMTQQSQSSTSQTIATATATPSVDASRQAQQDAFIASLARRQDGDPMAMGAVNAPVVLIEYADYRCPYCSVFAEETLPGLQSLIDDGTLRVEFHDLAIFGEDSVNAAAGARAAGQQGLFWEFQQALYRRLPNQGHPEVGDDLIFEIATQVGVPDLTAFETAYRSEEVRQAVLDDSAQAQSMGITGTPFFFVGTQQVHGSQPLEVFQQIIAAEKEKLN